MKQGKRRAVALAAVVCSLVIAAGVAAGCSPQPKLADTGDNQPQAAASADADGKEANFGYANFVEESAGLLPDVMTNAKHINAGNRGCNSCHDDLLEVSYNLEIGEYNHIIDSVGYGKKGTVYDCLTCHHMPTALCGFVFSDLIHTLHYGNEVFLENNGNCWSCHALTNASTLGEGEFNVGTTVSADADAGLTAGHSGAKGEQEMVLFEDVLYSAALGGYPDAMLSDWSRPGEDQTYTSWWAKSRGWNTGFISGATVDKAPDFKADMTQEASAEEDFFVIENWGRLDNHDVYNETEWMNDWKLKVNGTKNGTIELSLDDIKAMPATEMTLAHFCVVNGYNGAQAVNRPMKGVLLKDFIDAVGLESDSYNTFYCEGVDGWIGPMTSGTSIEQLIRDDAILVYENWGHDMTAPQGGPLTLIVPGIGGGPEVKMLDFVTFSQTEDPQDFGQGFHANWATPLVNSFWFDNDGVEGKVGQALELKAGAYGHHITNYEDCVLGAVEFSFDYGKTWQRVDIPQGFDPHQMTTINFSWTPKEAGTYVLKMRSVSTQNVYQGVESSIIVSIAE